MTDRHANPSVQSVEKLARLSLLNATAGGHWLAENVAGTVECTITVEDETSTSLATLEVDYSTERLANWAQFSAGHLTYR